jgi:hypothetical protein
LFTAFFAVYPNLAGHGSPTACPTAVGVDEYRAAGRETAMARTIRVPGSGIV